MNGCIWETPYSGWLNDKLSFFLSGDWCSIYLWGGETAGEGCRGMMAVELFSLLLFSR